MNKNLISLLVGGVLALSVHGSSADSEKGAGHYLHSCLPLDAVKSLAGLPLSQFSRNTKPQVSCSYSDREQLSKQSRVVYGRDPSYRKAFGESDIMQKVDGLGEFAEFDMDAGQLYVNVGNDGLVFEGRKGKEKLSLDKLKKIAEKVLNKP